MPHAIGIAGVGLRRNVLNLFARLGREPAVYARGHIYAGDVNVSGSVGGGFGRGGGFAGDYLEAADPYFAQNEFGRAEIPREELRRAYDLLDELADHGGEARVLAGDFNLRDPDLPGPNIDHVVVGGASHGPLVVWEPERRRLQNGAMLSDHAPVEVTIA